MNFFLCLLTNIFYILINVIKHYIYSMDTYTYISRISRNFKSFAIVLIKINFTNNYLNYCKQLLFYILIFIYFYILIYTYYILIIFIIFIYIYYYFKFKFKKLCIIYIKYNNIINIINYK